MDRNFPNQFIPDLSKTKQKRSDTDVQKAVKNKTKNSTLRLRNNK